MTNERLRALLAAGDVSVAGVAEQIGVDRKTVERWITAGRVPHRSHRLRLAQLLGKDEVFIWPETASDTRARSASEAEFVTLYPNRGAIGLDTWTSLLNSATESIDLLAYAASFLHDAIPDFDVQLADCARNGVRVRLLFGDPDSAAVALRGEEEGIGDLLAARCRLTWNYLQPILDVPGVEARAHAVTLYNSIFRFDNTLLANTHTYGAAASHSPVLHLHRIPGGRLFDHYMRGFERSWSASAPGEEEPGRRD